MTTNEQRGMMRAQSQRRTSASIFTSGHILASLNPHPHTAQKDQLKHVVYREITSSKGLLFFFLLINRHFAHQLSLLPPEKVVLAVTVASSEGHDDGQNTEADRLGRHRF